jgi:hypothetical protein
MGVRFAGPGVGAIGASDVAGLLHISSILRSDFGVTMWFSEAIGVLFRATLTGQAVRISRCLSPLFGALQNKTVSLFHLLREHTLGKNGAAYV